MSNRKLNVPALARTFHDWSNLIFYTLAGLFIVAVLLAGPVDQQDEQSTCASSCQADTPQLTSNPLVAIRDVLNLPPVDEWSTSQLHNIDLAAAWQRLRMHAGLSHEEPVQRGCPSELSALAESIQAWQGCP